MQGFVCNNKIQYIFQIEMTTIIPYQGRQAPFVILAAATIIYALFLGRMSGGGMIFNSYPFISDDGFDWLYQGCSLHDRLSGALVPSLHVLRDPGFVFIVALDSFMGETGAILLLAHAFSFFTTGLSILVIGGQFRVRAAVISSVIIIFILFPLNFFRLFILTDPLAVAFLSGSACSFVIYIHGDDRRHLILAATLALMGGMTQTYAAIPFFIGITLDALLKISRRQRLALPLILFLSVTIGMIFFKVAWGWALPHLARPASFGLIRPSFNNAEFYLHAWGYVFIPLIPAFSCGIWWWRKHAGVPHTHAPTTTDRRALSFLAACVIVFATLSFFYQWPDARFTFIYFPIVLMLLLRLGAGTEGKAESMHAKAIPAGFTASVILVALQSVITPETYWTPRLDELKWNPKGSWIAHAAQARATDRLGVGFDCKKRLPPAVNIPTGISKYQNIIFNDYVALRGSSPSRLAIMDELPEIHKDQHRWRTSMGSASGFVDEITHDGEYLHVRGWALDRKVGLPRALYFYLDDMLIGRGVCGDSRPDVLRALKLSGHLMPGFNLKIKIDSINSLEHVRVVAYFRDDTSEELKMSVSHDVP
jgi:hypothetical protein